MRFISISILPKNGDIFQALREDIPLQDVLLHYCPEAGLKDGGGGRLVANCPLPGHADDNASFTIYPDGNTYYCFGCSQRGDNTDLVVALFNLKPIDAARKIAGDFNMTDSLPKGESNDQIVLTVEALAADKRLNPDKLKRWGVKQHKYGVQIQYLGISGKPSARQRLRTALKARDGSKWLKGKGSPDVYGLWLIQKMAANYDYLVLVEGETDAWTLWTHGLPALGIPGADMTKKIKLNHIASFTKIYAWQEPDAGGETFISGIASRLTSLGYKGETYLIRGPEGIKDPNQLHAKEPGQFLDQWNEIIKLAEKIDTETAREGKTRKDKSGGRPSPPAIYTDWLRLIRGAGYDIDPKGNLEYVTHSESGDTFYHPLANFTARPTREVVLDNGMETTRQFEMAGIIAPGRPLPAVMVPADKFVNLQWIPAAWGVTPNIEPGAKNKDRLRHAIQSFAGDIETEHVFTHLGWRELAGRWVYLHAGGAVGADGENINVDLIRDGLNRYALPTDDSINVVDAVKMSLRLLHVAPQKVTIPLLSLVFLSPLCEVLRRAGIEPGFVLWLVGISGSMKSTLAGIFMCHFGEFTGKTLPASFKDTANSLEKKSFLVKDSLLVVDDYHPTASVVESSGMQATAQRLLRLYGDRVGRGRMRADTSLRPTYMAQGCAIVTGEDVPNAGQSTLARYLAVEMEQGDVDTRELTKVQNEHLFKWTMFYFLKWLAVKMNDDMENLKTTLRQTFITQRALATENGQHARVPEVAAWLYLGYVCFLSFARDSGVLSDDDLNEKAHEGWGTLLELAEKQGQKIRDDNPAKKFIELLREMLAAGLIYLLDVDPMEDQCQSNARPGFAGWFDGEWIYLLPETVYKSICQFAQAQGGKFPVTAKTLWEHLSTDGLILSVTESNGTVRRTMQKKIGGLKHRVLQLKKDVIFDDNVLNP